MMTEHGQVAALLMTLIVFGTVMVLVLKRKITERFAILWIAISLMLLLASTVGFGYLFKIGRLFGIPYPASALFLVANFGLSLLILELYAWVSKLNERSRLLAQELALLRDSLDREVQSPGKPGRATVPLTTVSTRKPVYPHAG